MTDYLKPSQEFLDTPTPDANSRERILWETAKLLIRKHSSSFSTLTISKATKVTQPLIHHHFKKKAFLFREVLRFLDTKCPDAVTYIMTREHLCEDGLRRKN